MHKILESSIIALKRPSLHEQFSFGQLILFRNGIAYIFQNLITDFKFINTYVSLASLPIYLQIQNVTAFTSEDLITVYTL